MIVDCAVYTAGQRLPQPLSPEEAMRTARETDGFVWIGLHEPSALEFESTARVFDLHPLAVEDAIHAHQRPKLERYGDGLFVVFKPAIYVDPNEVVEVGQVMVFLGERFVVTVRHGRAGALASLRADLEAHPKHLTWGPTSVLYALADKVVDDYGKVITGVNEDIDQIEHDVFTGPTAVHAERIFKLKRELLEFRRAVDPLEPPLAQLASGIPPTDKRSPEYFRDVHDHLLRVSEGVAALDALLDSALNANVAQVAMQQNEDMRKISAWVAIIAVPTMIAGIYGMNFDYMPELGWVHGYPSVLVIMALACFALYRNFKRRRWL